MLVAAGLLALAACSDPDPAKESAAPAGPATAPAAAPAPVKTDWVADARLALKEGRLIAPAGNNAVEIYLSVAADDPRRTAAQQALLELLSPAAGVIENTIQKAQLDEAARELGLLERMGASEITLSPLRAQLAAARKKLADEAAAKVAAEAAAAAAAAAPPPVAARPTPPVAVAPAPVPAPPASTSTPPRTEPASTRPSPPTATTPAPTPATETDRPPPTPIPAPASSGEVREARQIADAAPVYPPQAARRKLEGSVELEFTVGANGALSDIRVVRSNPPNIFDREAIRAAQRWRFSPRTEGGVPVSSKVRKTLNFRLRAS